MLQTRKIGNGLCAVSFDPTEILIRPSGKQYFGTERSLARVKDSKLIVDPAVARAFGITICVASSEE